LVYYEIPMRIHVNGRISELNSSYSLHDFITHSAKKNDFIVAELNGHIIKKPDWETTRLNEGDTLELVTLYGGG